MSSRRVVILFALLATVVANGCAGRDGASEETRASSVTEVSEAPTDAPAVSPADVSTESTTESSTDVSTNVSSDSSGGGAYDFTAVSKIVQSFVDERGLNGAGLVVVDREDGVVYEDYFGEFNATRVSLVASSSKMVTAGVLLRLQDDGLLDINKPITEYVKWGPSNHDVTIAQLLSNSSGLVGLLPNPAYGPYLCQYIATGTLQDCAKSIFTGSGDDADVVAPDTEFRYGGAQWQVAGAVAEAVSGKSWTQLIDEIYVQPCGLKALGFNNHFSTFSGFSYPKGFTGDPATLPATQNPNMEGGMYVTAPDYAKLLLMHLRGGMCDEQRVLSQDALDAMHADRVAKAYSGNAGATTTGYGMGWWVDRESGRIRDPGAYGSVPWLDLDDGFGAYLVVESDNPTGEALASLLYEPVETALKR